MAGEERKVIAVKASPRTPQEAQIGQVLQETQEQLNDLVENAPTLTDFIANCYATRSLFRIGISWMRGDQGEITSAQVLGFYLSDAIISEAKKDANVAQQARVSLDQLPNEPEKIKMAMRRVRFGNNYYRYAVVAQLPQGKQVEDWSLGDLDRDTNEHPDIVIFSPETPCTLHACDDLYKIHRNTAFYVDFKTGKEAMMDLERTPGGAAEYQLSRSDDEAIKQDAPNYLLVGINGRFTNENRVARISKFWQKQA